MKTKTARSKVVLKYLFLGQLCVSVLSGLSSANLSAVIPFADLWRQVRANAPEVKAAHHELEASRINERRMSRYAYPRVFAEARAFSTNDPAMAFMSLLGQRQIATPDFSPQALNQPGSHFYEHGTLGLDLVLFEGGAKRAQAEASAKMVESKGFELGAAEVAQYSGLAAAYSSLLTLQNERSELQKLAANVEATVSHYRIGSKSNPVGYSGLLGLKNLQNRLKGLMLENSSKTAVISQQIRIQAGDLPQNWMPKTESAQQFMEIYLSAKTPEASSGTTSLSVQSVRLAADALEKSKDTEKAKLLPKVGIYGTGDLYAGGRSAATSYTAGAYAQWDIFSASNYGAIDEVKQRAAAAEAKADALSQQEEIVRFGARKKAEALQETLSLFDESANYLSEQTGTTQQLFQNGSINALQLVEVLVRRAELLTNRAQAELDLAQARSSLLIHSVSEGSSL